MSFVTRQRRPSPTLDATGLDSIQRAAMPCQLCLTPVRPSRSFKERNCRRFPIGGPADVDGSPVRSGERQPVRTDPTPDAVSPPLNAALLRQLPVIIQERQNFPFAERFHPFGFLLHGRRFIVGFLLSMRATSSSAFSAASISNRNASAPPSSCRCPAQGADPIIAVSVTFQDGVTPAVVLFPGDGADDISDVLVNHSTCSRVSLVKSKRAVETRRTVPG